MRRWVVWGALICTLVACWWVERNEEPVRAVAVNDQPRVQRKVTLAEVIPNLNQNALVSEPMPDAIAIAPAEDAGVNLFSAMPMPLAETAVIQPPQPVNPYTYAGRLQEDGRWVVFLTDGQQQYVLREGDRFAEGWQVALLDQQKVVLQHAAERFEIRLDNGVVF